MKRIKIDWQDNNNVKCVFGDGFEISFTIKNLSEFQHTLNEGYQFIHINDEVSINLNQVKYIIYKKEGD